MEGGNLKRESTQRLERQPVRVCYEPGEILNGQYEVLRLLGRGGTGTVYLVSDNRQKHIWAVKAVDRSCVDDDVSFMRRTEALRKLRHPRLPSIVDLFETDDALCVVMDYIEGRTLSEVIRESGPQPQDQAVKWACQLCEVLDYLHSCQPPVIYRDMKPANIMLKPDGSIVLFDLGIAREYKEWEMEEDTTCLGTPGYAAPEQFGGNGQSTPRTDIYCLGATLYHILTGISPAQPPYEMYPIRKIDPGLSSGLESIILKCTRRNPQERYGNCKELLAELKNYRQRDHEFLAEQKKRAAAWIIVLFFCAAGIAAGSIGAAGIIRENETSYAHQLGEAGDLAVDSIYREQYDPDVLTAFTDVIDRNPSRPEAYLRLLDYCNAVHEIEIGLDTVCIRIDAGAGRMDRNNELLMEVARLWFEDGRDYVKAARYFSMVRGRQRQEAQWYGSLSQALGSFSIRVDWNDTAKNLQDLENYLDGQQPQEALRGYRLIVQVYLSAEQQLGQAGINSLVRAQQILEKARQIAERDTSSEGQKELEEILQEEEALSARKKMRSENR